MLLAEGLPTVVKKVLELSGYCAFVLALDASLVPEVQVRLAELQPAEGPHNQ
jgi:hypothetical protein